MTNMTTEIRTYCRVSYNSEQPIGELDDFNYVLTVT